MYRCYVERTFHYRDYYNYPTSKSESEVLEAETLDELYEQMARYRLEHESDEQGGYEYHSVEFGCVLRIVDTMSVDEERLESTSVWQTHLADKAQKAEVERLLREEERRAASRRAEEQERTTLARLKAKYPDAV